MHPKVNPDKQNLFLEFTCELSAN